MENGVDVWNRILDVAMKIPFVKVNRDEFLRKELARYCTADSIEDAVQSPIKVLSKDKISRIANGCIKYHLTVVCSTSALTGLPGGIALAGTIPADLAQFYGHIFCLTQKLLYLYGWPELTTDDKGKLDDNTAHILTIFVGVMMGAEAASRGAKVLTKLFAEQVAIRLPKQALTKHTIYNITKQVAKWIGIKLTKDGLGRGLSKIIPIIGAPISAGITYATFRPMAYRLKKELAATLD